MTAMTSGQRVCLLTEFFWPDEAGTGRYLGDLVRQLGVSDPGMRFQVVTSRRLYRSAGHPALTRTERLTNGVVHRLPSYRSGRDGFVRRLLADGVFSVRLAATMLRVRCDCLMLVTNPPLAPMLVSQIARLRRLPYVYLIHDLYPDVPVALGMWPRKSPMVRALARMQRASLRSACAVVVLGRCMRDHVTDHYDVPTERVLVIPHWTTLADALPFRRPATPPDPFTVLYSGNLGRFQDFDTLLDAAELLRDRRDVRFRIAGDGARREFIAGEVARRALTNVELTGFVPDEAFAAQLAATALGVVSLEPQLEGIGVPSKSYNLLGAGVPLVAIMSARSEIARVITETGCGIRVDHGASTRLAQSIISVADDPQRWSAMSLAAIRFTEEHGGLRHAADAYASVIGRCAAARRRA